MFLKQEIIININLNVQIIVLINNFKQVKEFLECHKIKICNNVKNIYIYHILNFSWYKYDLAQINNL